MKATQVRGWRLDPGYLHRKFGSLSSFRHFAYDLRGIVRAGQLPGCRLAIEVGPCGPRLVFSGVLPGQIVGVRDASNPVDKP